MRWIDRWDATTKIGATTIARASVLVTKQQGAVTLAGSLAYKRIGYDLNKRLVEQIGQLVNELNELCVEMVNIVTSLQDVVSKASEAFSLKVRLTEVADAMMQEVLVRRALVDVIPKLFARHSPDDSSSGNVSGVVARNTEADVPRASDYDEWRRILMIWNEQPYLSAPLLDNPEQIGEPLAALKVILRTLGEQALL